MDFIFSSARWALLIIVAAVVYSWLQELGKQKDDAFQIFQGLSLLARSATLPPALNIAIGVNTNLDLVVDALPVFRHLGLDSTLPGQDHRELSSKKELSETFGYYFKTQGAAERFVSSDELWASVLGSAETQQAQEYHIGGNAALMAKRFAELGATVLLAGPIGPKLKELLPSEIKLTEDEQSADEVHLILEYRRGESWGTTKASRANRFILTRDLNNAQLKGIEELQRTLRLKLFQPSVIVLSGLHNLVGADGETRTRRLDAAAKFLQSVEASVPVHLEMASIGDKALLTEICNTLFPLVDSLGFNEQELADIYSAVGGGWVEARNITKKDMSRKIPEPMVVQHGLQYLLDRFSGGKAGRSLKRVHFHSLSFHMLAERVQDSRTELFEDGLQGLATGSLQATLQACDCTSEDVTTEMIELIGPLRFRIQGTTGILNQHISKVKPMARWTVRVGNMERPGERDFDAFRFTLVPVMVCKAPSKTVGLGDAISATALAFSIRESRRSS